MKKLVVLFGAISLLGINAAKAQIQNPDTTTRTFIINASIGNMQEIVSGKIAAQKAVSPEVKAFASRMVADHSKAEKQLLQLAKQKGYQIPPEATETPAPEPIMEKATGKEFDKMYVHMMVPGHRNTVYMFETYAIGGKDPDVKAFAQQTLPTLKQHLTIITAIDNKMTKMMAMKSK
jgi:putative membrane protein